MLRLRTFGELSIESDAGALTGAATQRRPLALLALVAACRPACRRDDLLLYLWPDSTPERARNVLKQTLYALRRDLKTPELFTGDGELKLNPAVITSDLDEFEAALDRGDRASAAELYRGGFLEGFRLPESPEFEQWRSREAIRIRHRFAEAVEALASEAERAGELRQAADLWHRLLGADPTHPRATLGLMRSLIGKGDSEGAVRQAGLYQALVEQRPGTTPSREVLALADQLRAGPAGLSAPQPLPPTEPTEPHASARPWLAAAAVILTIILAALARYTRAHYERSRLDPNLLVVAPYQVLDPSLALWREGLVDVLSRRLDGAGPLRTVTPSVALGRWRGHPEPGSAADLGRRTGAGYAVLGSLIRAGRDSVLATAAVVESSSGRVICEVERRDAVLRMDRLSDSLTVELLREFERWRGSAVTSPTKLGAGASIEVLKAYLRGEQFYRRSRWDSARVYYEQAVAHDSSFALGLRRLGQVLGWQRLTVDTIALGYLLRAGAANHGLAPRDSLLIEADSLLAAANLATGAAEGWGYTRRLFTTLEDAVRRYPDASGAWAALGEARYHFGTGPVVGVSDQEVLAAFDRAIALDSGFAGAYIHPVELGFNLGGPAVGLAYARRYLALDPQEPQHRGVRLVVSLLDPERRPRVDRARLLDTVATEALVSARTILRRWPDSAETAVRLGRLLAQGRPSTYPLFADTGFMRRRLAEQLAWRGHLHEASRVLGGRQVPLFAELAVLGAIPADSAAATFERWSREDPAGVRVALSWWSDRRNAADISAYHRQALRRATSGSEQGDRSEAAYDVEAATAYRLLATGDSVQASRAFRRLPDTLCTACYLDRLVRARLLIRSGSYVEAYRDLSEPLDAFLTPMEIVFALERGRLAERLGDRREAERAYRLVSEAWAHGDRAALSLVSEARSGLERVGRPRGLAVRTSD